MPIKLKVNVTVTKCAVRTPGKCGVNKVPTKNPNEKNETGSKE